jgi:hypothetical protein
MKERVEEWKRDAHGRYCLNMTLARWEGRTVTGFALLKMSDDEVAHMGNYTEDLNEVARLERKLTRDQAKEYRFALCVLTIMEGGPITASALRRCQALCLALKLESVYVDDQDHAFVEWLNESS